MHFTRVRSIFIGEGRRFQQKSVLECWVRKYKLRAHHLQKSRERGHLNFSQGGSIMAQSMAQRISAADHSEGTIARTIEQQTAKLPSDTFLWAALGSIGLSLGLMLTGQNKKANFVGQWAPTFLILGLYNKIVKLHGSDAGAQ